MDFRHRALLLLLTVTACLGCRNPSLAQRELLERELRLQEDRIYELEAMLEDTQAQLKRMGGGEYCPAPGGELHFSPPTSTIIPDVSRPLGSTSPGSSPSSTFAPGPPTTANSGPMTIDTSPPKVELPTNVRKEAAPPYSVPSTPAVPDIVPPDPNVPEGLPGRGAAPPAAPIESLPAHEGLPPAAAPAAAEPTFKVMSSPKFRSPSATPRPQSLPVQPPEVLPEAALAAPADATVSAVAVSRRTGGWNSDGKPGDDGLLIVLEPRNEAGEIVPGGGEISLVLIDPQIVGEGGRYARWDFTAADAAATYRPALDGNPPGLYFELPWPDAPPAHARLKLFVRFTTSDGRRLQAERDVTVQLDPNAAYAPPQPTLLPAGAVEGPALHGAMPSDVVPAVGPAIVPLSAEMPPPTPLKWSGPKVSLRGQPQPLPSATQEALPMPEFFAPPNDALEMPPVPTLDNLLEGPSLFPADGR